MAEIIVAITYISLGILIGIPITWWMQERFYKNTFHTGYLLGINHGRERERIYRECGHMLAVDEARSNPRKFEVIRGGKE